jgi:hypothetical protein
MLAMFLPDFVGRKSLIQMRYGTIQRKSQRRALNFIDFWFKGIKE